MSPTGAWLVLIAGVSLLAQVCIATGDGFELNAQTCNRRSPEDTAFTVKCFQSHWCHGNGDQFHNWVDSTDESTLNQCEAMVAVRSSKDGKQWLVVMQYRKLGQPSFHSVGLELSHATDISGTNKKPIVRCHMDKGEPTISPANNIGGVTILPTRYSFKQDALTLCEVLFISQSKTLADIFPILGMKYYDILGVKESQTGNIGSQLSRTARCNFLHSEKTKLREYDDVNPLFYTHPSLYNEEITCAAPNEKVENGDKYLLKIIDGNDRSAKLTQVKMTCDLVTGNYQIGKSPQLNVQNDKLGDVEAFCIAHACSMCDKPVCPDNEKKDCPEFKPSVDGSCVTLKCTSGVYIIDDGEPIQGTEATCGKENIAVIGLIDEHGKMKDAKTRWMFNGKPLGSKKLRCGHPETRCKLMFLFCGVVAIIVIFSVVCYLLYLYYERKSLKAKAHDRRTEMTVPGARPNVESASELVPVHGPSFTNKLKKIGSTVSAFLLLLICLMYGLSGCRHNTANVDNLTLIGTVASSVLNAINLWKVITKYRNVQVEMREKVSFLLSLGALLFIVTAPLFLVTGGLDYPDGAVKSFVNNVSVISGLAFASSESIKNIFLVITRNRSIFGLAIITALLLPTNGFQIGGDVASRPPHWMGVDYYCTMVDCWVCVAGFNDPEHCHKQYFKKRLIPSHRRNHSLAGSSNDVDGNKTVHLCVMNGCYVCTLPARTDCHFEPFQRAASPVRLGALQRIRSNCNETMCWFCMGLGNCAARGDCCVYENVLQARPAALFSAAPEEQKSVSCHTLNGVKTCTVCDERGACRTTTSGGDEPEQQPAWPEYTNCNATHCWLCKGVSPCGERGDCCRFVHLLPDRSNCNATHCWECRLGCALFSRHCGGCTFVPIFGPKRVGREEAAAAEEEQNENYHTESDDDATGGGKKREADSVEDQYWADGSIGKKREADSVEDQYWADGSIGKKREAIRARREEADFD